MIIKKTIFRHIKLMTSFADLGMPTVILISFHVFIVYREFENRPNFENRSDFETRPDFKN